MRNAQDQITELASRQGALDERVTQLEDRFIQFDLSSEASTSQILLHNLPCSNKIFQERRQPFSAMEGAFNNNRVVISGPGSFGKSQLAKFYVHRCF
ncbi:MAG: hypothetical protein MRQ07_05450 [Candidatus Midichloria sp.]|nr:hypothetical protein [Candidatus Midichloria sp.]